MNHSILRYAFAGALTACLLSACGKGGGDTGAPPAPPKAASDQLPNPWENKVEAFDMPPLLPESNADLLFGRFEPAAFDSDRYTLAYAQEVYGTSQDKLPLQGADLAQAMRKHASKLPDTFSIVIPMTLGAYDAQRKGFPLKGDSARPQDIVLSYSNVSSHTMRGEYPRNSYFPTGNRSFYSLFRLHFDQPLDLSFVSASSEACKRLNCEAGDLNRSVEGVLSFTITGIEIERKNGEVSTVAYKAKPLKFAVAERASEKNLVVSDPVAVKVYEKGAATLANEFEGKPDTNGAYPASDRKLMLAMAGHLDAQLPANPHYQAAMGRQYFKTIWAARYNEFDWPKKQPELLAGIQQLTALVAPVKLLYSTHSVSLDQYDMATQSFALNQYQFDNVGSIDLDSVDIPTAPSSSTMVKAQMKLAKPLSVKTVAVPEIAARAYIESLSNPSNRQACLKIVYGVDGLAPKALTGESYSIQGITWNVTPRKLELYDSSCEKKLGESAVN